MTKWFLVGSGLVLAVLLLACSSSSGSSNGQTATREAFQATLAAQRAEAEQNAAIPGGEATPVSAASGDSVADSGVVAARETATAVALQYEAAGLAGAEAQATATAVMAATLAPIHTQLIQYGVDPNQGRLAWVHAPVTLEALEHGQYEFVNHHILTTAGDFVLVADITWETLQAETGCGFAIRSDGNEDAINQYLIIATRGGLGRVLFAPQKNGNVMTDEGHEMFAHAMDPAFGWHTNKTNRLAVVAQGQTFSIFTNETLLGRYTTTQGFDRGFVYFLTGANVAPVTCHFENGWLWLLD